MSNLQIQMPNEESITQFPNTNIYYCHLGLVFGHFFGIGHFLEVILRRNIMCTKLIGQLLILLFLCAVNIHSVLAASEMLVVRGFRISHEVVLPGQPDVVYDAATGDISGWWDHTFSEKPEKFYIEAKPGGGFYEIFDESGDGVKHATVIMAQRGKLLRFEGPLGLSGNAIHMIHTYEFSEQGSDSTMLKLTVNALGEVNKQLADTVDRVWYHFLFEQFRPYMEEVMSREK